MDNENPLKKLIESQENNIQSTYKYLTDIRNDLLMKRRKQEKNLFESRAIYYAACSALILVYLTTRSFSIIEIAGLILIGLSGLFLNESTQRKRLRMAEDSLKDVHFELDMLRFRASKEELRAEKLVQISNAELRRYYDLNLSQNSWSFNLGLICIALGVLVTFTTMYLVFGAAKDLEVQLIIGIVGGISTFMTNYVASIYLKMHAEASKNLGDFHSRLAKTHQKLLSNLIAMRIEDPDKKWETISKISTEERQD